MDIHVSAPSMSSSKNAPNFGTQKSFHLVARYSTDIMKLYLQTFLHSSQHVLTIVKKNHNHLQYKYIKM